MPTLDELLTVRSEDAILDGSVLPAMRGRGLNVTAWGPLDPWRILALATATLRRGIDIGQATWTAAGFGEYVFGRAALPQSLVDAGISLASWARLRALSWYGVTPIEATYYRRRITLTNASATAYGPLAAGKMIVRFASSNRRYIQEDDAVTIPAAGAVDVIFRSEYPTDTFVDARNYGADPTGAADIQFVTAAYPGVALTNPAPTYSDVSQVGSGLGTLTLGGAPAGDHSVAVRIDSTGQSGVATWSTSLDGGAWTSHGAAPNVVNLGGVGINITLTNGASAPSFLAGSVYYFSTPGTDVVQVGRNAETAEELGRRCYAVWASLGFAKDSSGNWLPFNPPLSAVEAVTRAISDEIKVVLVRTSSTVNNVVEVRIAGQGAKVTSGTLALAQLYWQNFAGLGDRYNVASPATVAINLGGATVKVQASLAQTAKATAQTRVNAYLTGVDPANPLPIGDGVAVIDRSYLIALIRTTPGVTGMDDGLTIEGAAANYTIPVDTLCTYAEDVATTLTWVPG